MGKDRFQLVDLFEPCVVTGKPPEPAALLVDIRLDRFKIFCELIFPSVWLITAAAFLLDGRGLASDF